MSSSSAPGADGGSKSVDEPKLKEVLPIQGELFFTHLGDETEVFCKPKIMPLKSVTLQRLEEIQRTAQETLRVQQEEEEKTRQKQAKAQEAASLALQQASAEYQRQHNQQQHEQQEQESGDKGTEN